MSGNDALDVHARVINDLMSELGMDGRKYTSEELHCLVRECFDMFGECWREYALWVLFGDDIRSRTMAIMRNGNDLVRIILECEEKLNA